MLCRQKYKLNYLLFFMTNNIQIHFLSICWPLLVLSTFLYVFSFTSISVRLMFLQKGTMRLRGISLRSHNQEVVTFFSTYYDYCN